MWLNVGWVEGTCESSGWFVSGSGHELPFVKGYGMFIALEPGEVQMLGGELLFITSSSALRSNHKNPFYLYYNSYCKGSDPLQAAGEVAQKIVGKSE